VKKCSKCDELKPHDQYNRNCSAKDGLQSACKSCRNAACRKKYAENPSWAEQRRERNSIFHREHRDKIAERKKAYFATEKGRELHRKHSNEWASKNKYKVRAHKVVERALKRGLIVKPEFCMNCASSRRLEAHHDDYTKLLEVKWLCKICHETLTIKKHSVKSKKSA
jgi:hypothetical protein